MTSDEPTPDVDGEPLSSIHMDLIENVYSNLNTTISKISESGFSIWIVGGAVRDSLSKISLHDFDLATNATPSQLMQIFPSAIPTGIAFGTITIPSVGDFGDIEITTLRKDGTYLDRRRPESVRFGFSLLEDLNRRDFKINAMAIDPVNLLFYDPHGGQKDLESGILSAVGEASQRLGEDGLRIMRAYRFMCHDSGPFIPDQNLSEALINSVENLNSISRERIWMEFSTLLSYQNVSEVLQRMVDDGVMNYVIPGCDDVSGVDNCNFEGISDNSLIIGRLSLLLKSFDEESVTQILKELLVSNKVRNSVISITKRIGIIPNTESKGCLRRYRTGLGEDLIPQISAERGHSVEESDKLRTALSLLPALSGGNKPLVSGSEILSRLKIEPSPLLGEIKQWLFRIQVEYDIPDSDSVWEKAESLGFIDKPLGEHRMWV
ncbi:MAG: CCA tRNA nucleotidyltransferase [Candidatus Thermoplasmatota archaeon]|nr:CCA tRNA nucleotidyltransferase [Candidatus Thermoplasmatota archaeon]